MNGRCFLPAPPTLSNWLWNGYVVWCGGVGFFFLFNHQTSNFQNSSSWQKGEIISMLLWCCVRRSLDILCMFFCAAFKKLPHLAGKLGCNLTCFDWSGDRSQKYCAVARHTGIKNGISFEPEDLRLIFYSVSVMTLQGWPQMYYFQSTFQ